jgi:hypothetical protein
MVTIGCSPASNDVLWARVQPCSARVHNRATIRDFMDSLFQFTLGRGMGSACRGWPGAL